MMYQKQGRKIKIKTAKFVPEQKNPTSTKYLKTIGGRKYPEVVVLNRGLSLWELQLEKKITREE